MSVRPLLGVLSAAFLLAVFVHACLEAPAAAVASICSAPASAVVAAQGERGADGTCATVARQEGQLAAMDDDTTNPQMRHVCDMRKFCQQVTLEGGSCAGLSGFLSTNAVDPPQFLFGCVSGSLLTTHHARAWENSFSINRQEDSETNDYRHLHLVGPEEGSRGTSHVEEKRTNAPEAKMARPK